MNQASPVQFHPLTQKPSVTLPQTEGRGLPIFHMPPIFSSVVSFMFFFSFSLVHASFLSLFIYLSEADTLQRPVPLCSPYNIMSLLPSSFSLHQGLGLCCRWNGENGTSQSQEDWVCRSRGRSSGLVWSGFGGPSVLSLNQGSRT